MFRFSPVSLEKGKIEGFGLKLGGKIAYFGVKTDEGVKQRAALISYLLN